MVGRTYPSITVMMMLCHRLDGLARSLELLAEQDYLGPWRLMLWNNNYEERVFIDEVAAEYADRINLEIVHSQRNHHCVARQSLVPLADGDLVMMIDDDILPRPSYLQHFASAVSRISNHGKHPAAICACGHWFSPEIAHSTAQEVWESRKGLEFYDEGKAERDIHFMHANNCMMPRDLLLKVVSHPPPSSAIGLVDDYWMSYVLSELLGARTVKIEAASVLEFAPEAFDPGTAMFNRSDVHEARLNLFEYLNAASWPWPGHSQRVLSD